MDEWVTEDRLDKTKIQLPKKEDSKKISKGSAGSRPPSPDRDLVNGNGTRTKAVIGRKRKANAMDKSSDDIIVSQSIKKGPEWEVLIPFPIHTFFLVTVQIL